jgi:hypothetical protein
MMKKTTALKTQSTTTKTASKSPVKKKSSTPVVASRKKVVSRGSRTTLSKVGSHTKRSGKRMLRAVLLSKALQVTSKALVGIFVFGTAMYGAYSFVSNTFAGDVVISKSEIVSRVGKLTTLPTTAPDAVVRVQDAETLKKQNSFYEHVKEGDYIIMYPALAVVYSLRSDSIVAIKKTDTAR